MFRGDTALKKIYINPSARYGVHIDLVQNLPWGDLDSYECYSVRLPGDPWRETSGLITNFNLKWTLRVIKIGIKILKLLFMVVKLLN